ncbi:hypothetical protein PC116_g3789 [Phytophthora cactorum]|nr:hypothetical protein Pcac1_g24108 [Phytophthora cactorum]KAG4248528.1 hypothetical protein PC116_g3789 [Phytophthora cactorum]
MKLEYDLLFHWASNVGLDTYPVRILAESHPAFATPKSIFVAARGILPLRHLSPGIDTTDRVNNTMNFADQEQTPAQPSAAVPTSAASATTTTSTPANTQEDVQSSNAPYAAVQPTPSAMKMASTLPPIAVAQPLGNISQIQSHLVGGSNIPVNPNAPQGIYQSGPNSANPSHPYVTVMTMAPVGPSGDAEADNMRFAFLQKCRWMAGCLMAYYVATFLFLQPFILGTLGLLTAFMGYYGSRPPVDAMRLKWLRWYIWANYVMLILNMWLLVVTLVFSGSMFTYGDNSGSHSDSSVEDEYMESTYYSSSVGLFVGLLVAANTLMHLRCLRTAQLLVAELVNAGVDRQRAAVVMLATANPTSAV